MNMHAASLAQAGLQVKPTRETYDRLQQAYEHFNRALFGGTLPNALITLQARARRRPPEKTANACAIAAWNATRRPGQSKMPA